MMECLVLKASGSVRLHVKDVAVTGALLSSGPAAHGAMEVGVYEGKASSVSSAPLSVSMATSRGISEVSSSRAALSRPVAA